MPERRVCVCILNFVQRGALSRMQIPWSKLKIGQELGVGGFGAVYKGLWQVRERSTRQLHLTCLPSSTHCIGNLHEHRGWTNISQLQRGCMGQHEFGAAARRTLVTGG